MFFFVENTNPLSQLQFNTDTIKMQPSPAYGLINNPTVLQHETTQVPSDHQDVPMVDNPAYLMHKSI